MKLDRDRSGALLRWEYICGAAIEMDMMEEREIAVRTTEVEASELDCLN